MRVLLIEDDTMFGKALVRGLTVNGVTVDWVKDGLDGCAALERTDYGIALIDIGLPDISGLEVIKKVRRSGSDTPMMVITARDGIEDMVAGLDFGADDYIVKPFELSVMLARMRAVLRRVNGRSTSMMSAHDVTLDPTTQSVVHRGIEHVLGGREYLLIHALMERPGRILSRSQIEDRIYGWGEEVQSNAVDVLIHGLRKKFGKDIIRNVRGTGWTIRKSGT